MREPKDIIVSVVDTYGKKMTLEVPWDASGDKMSEVFKTILVFLEYAVDRVVINPEPDHFGDTDD
jgi:hypothetical protein